MFSYCENGIKDTIPSKFIGLPELVQLIRLNPYKEKIETIRNLRQSGDQSYKIKKSELPNITPVCMVRERNLDNDNFEKNFIQFSQYLYYDIDTPNAQDFKDYFISRYAKVVSLVCISSSGGGISILVKVKNTITRDNFPEVWQNVRDAFFKDEKVDTNCTNIGRAMFVSYDPDVFCNYENELELTLTPENIKSNKKETQYINLYDFNNTLDFPELMQVGDILKTLATKTIVPVSNPVLDYKPQEIVKFFIPRIILDSQKHNTYRRMIHTLVFLNPEANRIAIFSYLWYINNRFAKPKMVKREFVRFFNLTYIQAMESGNLCITKNTVWIHFNQNCGLTPSEKRKIASIINGVKAKNESIKKIIEAKANLSCDLQPVSYIDIRELTGLSIKTIRKYYNSEIEDLDNLIKALNDTFAAAA